MVVVVVIFLYVFVVSFSDLSSSLDLIDSSAGASIGSDGSWSGLWGVRVGWSVWVDLDAVWVPWRCFVLASVPLDSTVRAAVFVSYVCSFMRILSCAFLPSTLELP